VQPEEPKANHAEYTELERATLAATRYFSRVETLRLKYASALGFLMQHFGSNFHESVPKLLMEIQQKNPAILASGQFPPMNALRDHELYFDLWVASLYNAKEGYDKMVQKNLSITSQEVDQLWENKTYADDLRKFRNLIYHFDLNYYNPELRFRLHKVETMKWIHALQDALHNFYDKHSRKLSKRYGLSDAVMEYANSMSDAKTQ
jgi:hypothetical protein